MELSIEPMQGTQMIDRTVTLLRLVATFCPRGARLTDLAQESGLPAPTVRRILKRLTQHGLVAQDQQDQRYALGPFSYELGIGANPCRQLAVRHRALLERFVAETGTIGYLLMHSGKDSLCIDKLAGTDQPPPNTRIQIGDRLPLGVGVGGMILLASLPEAEADAVIAANASISGRFVRTTGPRFQEHLTKARSDGYVIRRSPVTEGVVGFGHCLQQLPGEPRLALAGAAVARDCSTAKRMTIIDTMRRLIAEHSLTLA